MTPRILPNFNQALRVEPQSLQNAEKQEKLDHVRLQSADKRTLL